MNKLLAIATLASLLTVQQSTAQETSLTREQILNMSTEELSELDLEELMAAVELLGVSSVDELFALIMNKNVSSASKKAEDSFKSPLSTSVITREEMRTYGCTSIEEALRLIPGVIAREKTNGNYDIHLRGLDNIPNGNIFLYTENTNTLVMVDGRPVFNYGTGAMMWETLPVGIEEINRIEVVRGACGALYGSNAVTGVINIITERPNCESNLISGSIQNGSSNTYVADLAIRKFFKDKVAMSLSGNFQMRNRPTSDLFLMPYESAAFVDERGQITDFSNGVYVSTVDMQYIHTTSTDSNGDAYYTGGVSEDTAPVDERFADSELARKNLALNYFLSITPKNDISFYLTTGYQQSLAMTSPVRNDFFSLNMRESKQFYADLAADIKGISLQVNYITGPQNFAKGAPSYKVKNQQFTGSLDYDWTITDHLSVRPGFNYRRNMMGDLDYVGGTATNYLGREATIASYFNDDCVLTAIAPSVRVDWSPNDQFRLVGAYRAEKMSTPDKWYHSYQVAVTYSLNDDNNLRLVGSRANRSSIFVNTSSNYHWDRTGMVQPAVIYVYGNPDADVMYADNIEIGYRWRPTKRFMIDVEAYYNISRDYGEMMATSSEAVVSTSFLNEIMTDLIDTYVNGSFDSYDVNTIITESKSSTRYRTNLAYQNLPFKVKNRGISLSADWIISSKLVAKINANIQKTTIDDYYLYDQSGDLATQCAGAYTALGNCMGSIYGSLYASYYNGTEIDYNTILTTLYDQFGITLDADDDAYSIGSSTDKTTDTENLEQNHKSESTPAFYGSVGLIYKPLERLSVAANSYFYTKQQAHIVTGSDEIKGKCIVSAKVGYKPIDNFEIFFNAHNLLNNRKREFLYADENKAVYSLGATFSF